MKSEISKRSFLKLIALLGFSFVEKKPFDGEKLFNTKSAVTKNLNIECNDPFASTDDIFNGIKRGHFVIDVSGEKIDQTSLLNEIAYSIWLNKITTIFFSSANSAEDIANKLLFPKTEMFNKIRQGEFCVENWYALCRRARILSQTPLSIVTSPYLTYCAITRKLKQIVKKKQADLAIIDDLMPLSLLELQDGETSEFKIGETFERLALELDITIVTLI